MSEPRNEPLKGLVTLIVCFVISWGICWLATVYYLDDWAKRSAFGEMFGSINTLFSGAALAGVIYAIFLQRRELQLQRHELELTRDELRRSAEAQEKSEAALREQIKQMQEQSELQLLPFVVVVRDEVIGWYKMRNAGNGTAMNIKFDFVTSNPDTNDSYVSSKVIKEYLMLTKGEEISMPDSMDIRSAELIRTIFSNINGKRYFTIGRLTGYDYDVEIEKFGNL